jgi:two-component system cell cycle response regulator DivK
MRKVGSSASRAVERRATPRGDRRRAARGGRRADDCVALGPPLPADPAPLILVVDDYTDARDMLTEFLRFRGFRVAEAATGLEALAQAAVLLPDLILLDLVLPDFDGWQVIARIRESERTKHVRIAVHTANVTPATRQQTRDAGVEFFLPRPCDLEILTSQIASAIDRESRSHVD